MIGKKEIIILEGKTGFLKTRLEKVYRLLEVLKEISQHPLLSKGLALKGGTAINLFIFDCPRLSIDLDFNFIGASSKEEADKTRKEVASRHCLKTLSLPIPSKKGGNRLWYVVTN